MPSDVLQKFLDQRLLDLGEDTDKFGYLKATADELARNFQENPFHLIHGSSVLLGGELGENEPIVELCKTAIKTPWPTYLSRFPASTTQLFRAILLQAMAQIADQDSSLTSAAIIFYTTRGLLSYLVSEGEDAIFREFLLSIGEKVEAEATRTWASPKLLAVPDINYSEGALPNVDTKALKEALKNAAGPAGGAGANPQWPSANSAEWLEHFGQGSANAIATVLKAMAAGMVTQGRNDNGTAVDAIRNLLVGVASDNLRAGILYWKEALFSPSRRVSYRKLSPDGIVYWAASDLHGLVPRFHPESVEYFLRETVRAVLGEEEAVKELTLKQFCSAIAHDPASIHLSHDVTHGQRLTFLEAVQGSAIKRVDPQAASVQTGIPAQTKIPREELAVLLFRDFQALRLAGSK